jgi:predicted DNA binding protein
LLRVEWDPEAKGILRAISDTHVSLISAVGTSEEWRFEARAEDRDAISEFQTRSRELDVPIELVGLHALSPMRSGAQYDLTETQREALVLAYERGFYQSPREVTLDTLAKELGITGQSLGSRLRRGTNRLIGSTLIGPTPTEWRPASMNGLPWNTLRSNGHPT